MLGLWRCEQRSASWWRFLQSRRRGWGENRLSLPPGLPMCWSDRCTWISLLCVCAIPKGAPQSKRRGGTRGKDFPNGCKSTWAAWASFLVRKSFLTLAARSHAAVLSFPLASMPRVVWSLRRALAPTFPARLTSCCFPWRPTTLRQRFRTRVCATSSTRRWRNSVRPATNSR